MDTIAWEHKVGIFQKLFESERHPRTALDEVREIGSKLIVRGYRGLGSENNCAPTATTSDSRIMEIYAEVGSSFQQVARARGEHIPAGSINSIVWKFLQVNEMLGSDMVDEHLNYELEKYRQEGLRPDYQQNLELF